MRLRACAQSSSGRAGAWEWHGRTAAAHLLESTAALLPPRADPTLRSKRLHIRIVKPHGLLLVVLLPSEAARVCNATLRVVADGPAEAGIVVTIVGRLARTAALTGRAIVERVATLLPARAQPLPVYAILLKWATHGKVAALALASKASTTSPRVEHKARLGRGWGGARLGRGIGNGDGGRGGDALASR